MQRKVVQFNRYAPSSAGGRGAAGNTLGDGALRSRLDEPSRQHLINAFYHIQIGSLCFALMFPVMGSGLGTYATIAGCAFFALVSLWQFRMARIEWNELGETMWSQAWWEGVTAGRMQVQEEYERRVW